MEDYCTTTSKSGKTIYWKVENGQRKRVSKKVYQDREMIEGFATNLLNAIHEEIDENNGAAMFRVEDVDKYGVLETLKKDSSMRVSEPVNIKHRGPSIIIADRKVR